MFKKICMGILLGLLVGCSSQTCVVVSTTSGVGIDVSYNPSTGFPNGRIGYIRNETAIVPTNRRADENKLKICDGKGALDSSNVLMEMNVAGIFNFTTDSLIYQRLSIGDKAIAQPGAVAMFAKNSNGEISTQASTAIQAMLNFKQNDTQTNVNKKSLLDLYVNGNQELKNKIVVELGKVGITSWDNFINGVPKELSKEDIEKVIEGVK